MERKSLVTALELASRALADGNLVPIFKCFAFDAAKQTVTAYNDLIGIVAPCTVEENFCTDGKTLLGLLNHSRAEEVEISIEEQDVILKAARSTFKLLPAEGFPHGGT
jgi:DNA polymerase III sliding clamp (beta) subunit (PCNA family)